MSSWVRDYLRRLGGDGPILHPIPPDVVDRLDQVLRTLAQGEVNHPYREPPGTESR